MRPGTWKAVLVFGTLFVAGGAVGSLVTLRVARPQPSPREGLSPQLVRRFTERLELTPEQSTRISPVLESHTEELRKIRRESFERTDAVSQRMLAAIETELTPGQRAKLEEMRKEQRARFERWMNDRDRDRDKDKDRDKDRDRRDGPSRASGGPGEPPPPEGMPPPPAGTPAP